MPLTIRFPDKESYDEVKEEFVYVKGAILNLEHSLLSISKWESKWHKPFLSKEEKTKDEMSDYIKCMSISGEISDEIIIALGQNELKKIKDYISDPMTATTINRSGKKSSNEIVTNELIYYWMTELNIPFDPCQKWHINRLLTLIEVASIKKTPAKKMPKSVEAKRRTALNASRKAKYHTRG